MALGEALIDADGVRHRMAGLLGLVTSYAQRRMHLGYRRATLLAPMGGVAAGAALRGHEFHYSTIVDQPDAPLAHVADAEGAPVPETGSYRGHVIGHLLPPDRRHAMTGFVSFVGSGPGDPELLTLKAVVAAAGGGRGAVRRSVVGRSGPCPRRRRPGRGRQARGASVAKPGACLATAGRLRPDRHRASSG